MAQPLVSDTKLKIISQHGICHVAFSEKTMQHALYASRDITKDEIIANFSAREILTEPNFLTVQVDHKKHILLQPEYLQYTNHSCEPNVFFDISTMKQVALRDIKIGEELTFFYPSTEWEMAKPFPCQCGSKKCLNIIRGAANVHPAILNEYRIGDFILSQKNNHALSQSAATFSKSFSALFSLPPKVWVLAPLLDNRDAHIDYYYDFTQSIAEYTRVFEELNLEWFWQPVTMRDMETVISSIAQEKKNCVPLVLNLCDGDEINGTPGVTIIQLLEKHQLIYTGSDEYFYQITTSKIPMKKAFDEHGVSTARWCSISSSNEDSQKVLKKTGTPVIVKPAVSGGSMGVGVRNVVEDEHALENLLKDLFEGYRGWNLQSDGFIAEQFIEGPEYTVFITGSHDNPEQAKVYQPVERVFHSSLPEKEKFLSFDRLWEIYETETMMPGEENFYEYRIPEEKWIEPLKKLAWQAYVSNKGVGYTRADIRVDAQTGMMYVLEVNAQCGISDDENFTSIGAILRLSGNRFSSLILDLLNDAIRRAEKRGWDISFK